MVASKYKPKGAFLAAAAAALGGNFVTNDIIVADGNMVFLSKEQLKEAHSKAGRPLCDLTPDSPWHPEHFRGESSLATVQRSLLTCYPKTRITWIDRSEYHGPTCNNGRRPHGWGRYSEMRNEKEVFFLEGKWENGKIKDVVGKAGVAMDEEGMVAENFGVGIKQTMSIGGRHKHRYWKTKKDDHKFYGNMLDAYGDWYEGEISLEEDGRPRMDGCGSYLYLYDSATGNHLKFKDGRFDDAFPLQTVFRDRFGRWEAGWESEQGYRHITSVDVDSKEPMREEVHSCSSEKKRFRTTFNVVPDQGNSEKRDVETVRTDPRRGWENSREDIKVTVTQTLARKTHVY